MHRCILIFYTLSVIWVHLGASQIVNLNFSQTVDHFNPRYFYYYFCALLLFYKKIYRDERTFSQRFQVLSNFYQKGGPIILIVGPERTIYADFEIYVSSVYSYFAPTLHAFIIATEHR